MLHEIIIAFLSYRCAVLHLHVNAGCILHQCHQHLCWHQWPREWASCSNRCICGSFQYHRIRGLPGQVPFLLCMCHHSLHHHLTWPLLPQPVSITAVLVNVLPSSLWIFSVLTINIVTNNTKNMQSETLCDFSSYVLFLHGAVKP